MEYKDLTAFNLIFYLILYANILPSHACNIAINFG